MFAVLRTGSKQYRVEAGTILEVERIQGSAGDKIQLKDVLLLENGDSIKVGTPLITGAIVDAEIVGQTRGTKVVSFKKIRRQGKRWKKGHRQELTKLRITKISA